MRWEDEAGAPEHSFQADPQQPLRFRPMPWDGRGRGRREEFLDLCHGRGCARRPAAVHDVAPFPLPTTTVGGKIYRLRDWFDRGHSLPERERALFGDWHPIADAEAYWPTLKTDVENSAKQILALRALSTWSKELHPDKRPFQNLAGAIGWCFERGLLT